MKTNDVKRRQYPVKTWKTFVRLIYRVWRVLISNLKTAVNKLIQKDIWKHSYRYWFLVFFIFSLGLRKKIAHCWSLSMTSPHTFLVFFILNYSRLGSQARDSRDDQTIVIFYSVNIPLWCLIAVYSEVPQDKSYLLPHPSNHYCICLWSEHIVFFNWPRLILIYYSL